LRAVKKGDVPLHKGKIRTKFINNCNFEADEKMKWVLETPYEIRDAALADLLAAYKTNFAKRKQNNDHIFAVKPKTKKAPSDSIVIHHKFYRNGGRIFKSFWRKTPKDHGDISSFLRGFERLPKTLDHAARLQRTRNGEFYLCVVSSIDRPESTSTARAETQGLPVEATDRVIALDPGVRSFMTGYCPGQGVMEWGAGDRTRLFRLCCAYDSLQSRWSKEKHRKRYRMQRAGRRIQERIRNLVNEVHCKLVKWLVTNFDLVLLPKFETQSMCQKTQFAAEDGTRYKTRKINGKVARAMYTWSHYRFQRRLLHKIREYPQCRVVICDEDFTSKTCGRCGFVHEKLGGNKRFKCPSCHVSLNRDVNGARNIFLRYMTLSHA
jgi:putative transposase